MHRRGATTDHWQWTDMFFYLISHANCNKILTMKVKVLVTINLQFIYICMSCLNLEGSFLE